MSETRHPYAAFLQEVESPARYGGGERFQVVKESDEGIASRMAFCFPDVYDIGMSHLGTKILYKGGERPAGPRARAGLLPLARHGGEAAGSASCRSSASRRAARSPISTSWASRSSYELTFTNVLNMLELGGIPIRSHDRGLEHPLVIAGGPVATQPEPMAPFIDGFLIGDAEERLPELMREHARLRDQGIRDREEMLVRLQAGGGLYCPALYDRDVCPRSGLAYVSRPRASGSPAPHRNARSSTT